MRAVVVTCGGVKFQDIPRFPMANYEVDIAWDRLEWWVTRADHPLILEPDYQRGHVWTEAQQIAFIEYGLRGGENSMAITTNCPGWNEGNYDCYELVDGLQRVTAVRAFMGGKIGVFGGHRIDEFTDRMRCYVTFKWRVLCFPTRAEVLRLYLAINDGGVVHSPEEIARVRALLEAAEQGPAMPGWWV